jgi:hypothetical protein
MPFLKSIKFNNGGREYHLFIDKRKNGDKSLEIAKVDSDQRVVINENDVGEQLECINQLMPSSAFTQPPPLPPSVPPPESQYKKSSEVPTEKKSKTNRYEEIRKTYPKAYYPWEKEDDENLERLYKEGKKTKELTKIFERQPGAIRSRLSKLGLVE